MQRESGTVHSSLLALALAASVVGALFAWQGSKGFDLSDEGFLWYGAQRVLLGEVPVRDFMSYDPGRYYLSAGFMRLWGDSGIMTLRACAAVVQALGLFVGLLLIARSSGKRDFPCLLLSAVTLAVWMYPRHKLYDISLSIFLVGILAFLAGNPSSRRYFLSGMFVGLVAVFGRNHGAYGVAGSIGVMAWLAVRRTEGPGSIKGLALWTSGVILGYAPVLFMMALVPGFAASYWESIQFLVRMNGTNLPLPVPWPWRVDYGSLSTIRAVQGALTGLFFLALPVFGVLTLVLVFRRRLRGKEVSPALVAASMLALPYAQYSFSRADVGHLALGIFPMLIGTLVLATEKPPGLRLSLAIALCAASVLLMNRFHPGYLCRVDDGKPMCVSVEISGDRMLVAPETARVIGLVRTLAERYASGGQSFIAAPFWPGAYPLTGRKSPMWEIYPLVPSVPFREQAEIERIKAADPRFAVILDVPLDGRDELRFRNTHPLVFRHITERFVRLPDVSVPGCLVYVAREEAR